MGDVIANFPEDWTALYWIVLLAVVGVVLGTTVALYLFHRWGDRADRFALLTYPVGGAFWGAVAGFVVALVLQVGWGIGPDGETMTTTSSSGSSSYSAPQPYYGGDLDCDDFSGPVSVGTYDPNGLDADNDGIGCEPYP